jgi:hypothetical protein
MGYGGICSMHTCGLYAVVLKPAWSLRPPSRRPGAGDIEILGRRVQDACFSPSRKLCLARYAWFLKQDVQQNSRKPALLPCEAATQSRFTETPFQHKVLRYTATEYKKLPVSCISPVLRT